MIKLIYQRIKLFSSKRKEFYLFLKHILGFYPGNLKLYDIAFIHKSASTTDTMGNLINNERLEYLGDAILGAVVAEFLYNRFPQRGEGFLTQMRSKLVNRAFLTQLINETGLHRFIKSRTIGSSTASNILGDALEALIGAIYLDKGFETARYVIIKRFLNGYVDLNKMEEQDNNYKSQLIEWGQKNKQEVSFQTEEENSPNSRFSIFVTTVEIENHLRGKGYGSSKKESQQNAACEALKDIDDESLPENH
jgi:ribonuclease-3